MQTLGNLFILIILIDILDDLIIIYLLLNSYSVLGKLCVNFNIRSKVSDGVSHSSILLFTIYIDEPPKKLTFVKIWLYHTVWYE